MDRHSHGEFSDRKRGREENPEASLASPEQVSKKKKRKKKKGAEYIEPHPQVCPIPVVESAVPIVPENVKGAKSNDANTDLCPKHENPNPETEKGAGPNVATVEHPVPDPIPQKKKKKKKKKKKRNKKKKNVPNPQGTEPELKESNNNVENPQLCSPVNPELNTKMKNVAEPKEAKAQLCGQAQGMEIAQMESNNAEQSQPHPCYPVNPELENKMKMEAGLDEAVAVRSRVFTNPALEFLYALNFALNQIQPGPCIPVCPPRPAFATDQTSLGDPAIPIDAQHKVEQKMLKAEAPFTSSKVCYACRKSGHGFQKCPRLKRLPIDVEICFFCGEIGHSLGKCSVSQAGGGRLARCLFCHAHGHFSKNCPQIG